VQSGGLIIGIVEWDGSLYDENGLDIQKILKHKKEKGTISYIRGYEKFHNEKPLFFKCDVLSLCAKE
jgi:glutamate dehydrogenase (NAD(P)+)